MVPALMLFGLFNATVSTPGTLGVRLAAVAATLAVLWWGDVFRTIVVLLAWLVWPPAYAVAWTLGRKSELAADREPLRVDTAVTRSRIGVAAIIVAVAIASLTYRLTVAHGLQQTAALFVGVPALLAIVVVFTVSPRTATGVACKAVTVGLLVSLVFLGEGMLCVAMSAPLFYAVAAGIAAIADSARRRRHQPTTLFSCLLIVTVPMSLEGVIPLTTVRRDESVTATKIVHASSRDVEQAIFEAPRFDRALPFYLRAGFPRAVATRIERGADGTRWIIRLRGGEMRLDGMEPRAGDLILTLEETGMGYVRWRAISDSSHMTHFLTWQEASVTWEPIDAGTTRVTWTLRYRRDLDPSWYFGPWERYAVRLAAGYLIDSVATP
jgi:hypothetical protein